MRNIRAIFLQPNMAFVFFLGFASGLPLALTGSTLNAWFTQNNFSLASLGFAGLIATPYTFKFLWAPFMDRWSFPLFKNLGRRRDWILCTQLLLCVAIVAMSSFSPATEAQTIVILGVLVAFLAASQDIVIDAYKLDLLHSEEYSLGAGVANDGYRIAMLISSGLALVLADTIGWRNTYAVLAEIMALCTLVTYFAPKIERVESTTKSTWKDTVVVPFSELLSRKGAIAFLLFIALYKLGDAFTGVLVRTFLMREMHLTLTQMGTIIKFSFFFGAVLGGTIGGLLTLRFGLYRALIIFGLCQALVNLIYLILFWTGPNLGVIVFATFMDDFFGGMGQAALMGLVMGFCNRRFGAAQFALLTSLSALGRTFIDPVAGLIAQHWGWKAYFVGGFAFALPGLILLYTVLKNKVDAIYLRDDMEDEREGVPTGPAGGGTSSSSLPHFARSAKST